MLNRSTTGLDKKRLRRWLLLFFSLLAIPTTILIYQAYSQLKWQALHLHRGLAEELALRIDRSTSKLIRQQEARSFTDYHFFQVSGDGSTGHLQRSVLSSYPIEESVPGLIGYFQVDPEGRFSTPLLPGHDGPPTNPGIPAKELEQRQILAARIRTILGENQLVQSRAGRPEPGNTMVPAPLPFQTSSSEPRQLKSEADQALPISVHAEDKESPAISSPLAKNIVPQAAFDRLTAPPPGLLDEKMPVKITNSSRIADLKLAPLMQGASERERRQQPEIGATGSLRKKQRRREQSILYEETPVPDLTSKKKADGRSVGERRIRTFESELDPLEFSLLDSGHLVLFRKVWRDGKRYIQGLLILQQPFLEAVFDSAFRETGLSRMSDLIVAFRGSLLSSLRGRATDTYLSDAKQLEGSVLYDTRLSAPLNDLELLFIVNRLPAGPGSTLIIWTAIILTLVLLGGFYAIYRLGARQIDLSRQQQEFVSAVSHELKTPLTSIRMYGEILLQGWADETKKQTYYSYIHDESERLSRLISNVLQLARVNRNELLVEIKSIPVLELLDDLRSRLASQVERAGFSLDFHYPQAARGIMAEVDRDGFIQIFINLVDNAVKFSSRASIKVVEIGCSQLQDERVSFRVRDYGPGVAAGETRKIFQPFYRAENELTRETVGTGIGLALVEKLTAAMNGRVDIINRQPGTEFRISLPGRATTS